MTTTFYIIECSLCHEAKPIHRELVLTDREGLLLAQARFCRDCWNNIRHSVEDVSGLIDRRQEHEGTTLADIQAIKTPDAGRSYHIKTQ